jgi:hypothetical protein
MIVLDTDHVSFLQRADSPEGQTLVLRHPTGTSQ